MADIGPTGRRFSRETRLLMVTIVVSAAVLLLLARLRFPQPPAVDGTAAQPLERLAARAPYDLLAGSVARLEETIAPGLIVLRIAPRVESAPRDVSDLLTPVTGTETVRHVPALRISNTSAVAAVSPEMRIAGIVGPADPAATAAIVATDAVRRLALIRVPEGPVQRPPSMPLADLQVPLYVVAVEGTHAGFTVRPVFLGRGDRFTPVRWSRPLLPLGGVGVTPGALMFTLDGQFLGAVVVEDGAQAIASGEEVIEAVEQLAAAPPSAPGDAGIAVQPLSRALAAATGAPTGVVVSEVRTGGPAADILEAGDVITAFGDRPVMTPEGLLLQIAAGRPGDQVPLAFVRNREPRTSMVTLGPALGTGAAANGSVLRYERGVGTAIVDVGGEPMFQEVGLQPGDMIVRAGDIEAPTPALIRRAVNDAMADAGILLVVRREGRQRVVAVRRPPELDVERR